MTKPKQKNGSAAVAAPLPPVVGSPVAIATAIIEWDRRGRLVDDESFVQNNAATLARSFCGLFEALRNITECAEAGDDGANMDLWVAQARDALVEAQS